MFDILTLFPQFEVFPIFGSSHSKVFLKLMGMSNLEHNLDHECDALQFGFIEKRGTTTAIVLGNDIIQYCNRRAITSIYKCC